MMSTRLALASALTLFAGLASAAPSWTRAFTVPTTSNLNGVAFANGEIVVVGANGEIFTSTDALTWTDRSPDHALANLAGVVSAGGQLLAYGSDGKPLVYRSTGGAAFQPVSVGGDGGGVGALVFSDRFLAFSTGDGARASTDATTWTETSSEPPASTERVVAAAHANGLTVAVTSDGLIVSSADGASWTTRLDAGVVLSDVVFAGGQWLAISSGRTFTSADGQTWTSHLIAPAANLRAVAFDGARYVAVGFSGAAATSTDGIAWTPQTTGLPITHHLLDIAWTGTQFIAVGTRGTVATSADGTGWTVLTTVPDFTDFTELGALGSLRVASGYRQQSGRTRIATQTGAAPWIDRGELAGDVQHLDYVAHGGELFAAVDDGQGSVGRSGDGVTWTNAVVDADAAFTTIVSDGTQLLLTADTETIYTSPDGTTWTSRRNGTTATALAEGVWTGAQFVLVGTAGVVMRSPDGINWTSGTVGNTSHNLVDVAFGSGLIVAASSSGSIFTSPDGAVWTQRTSGVSELASVAWTGQGFVAVGFTGTAVRSANGTAWTVESTGVNLGLAKVAMLDGTLHAAGPGMLVLTGTATANTPPTATAGSLAVNVDQSASGTLVGADADGGTLTFSIVSPPRRGVLTLTNANTGAYTYTPATGQTADDVFSFRVTDGAASSVSAVVNIDVRTPGGGGGGGGATDGLVLALGAALLFVRRRRDAGTQSP